VKGRCENSTVKTPIFIESLLVIGTRRFPDSTGMIEVVTPTGKRV
jgi:hypothetical protein